MEDRHDAPRPVKAYNGGAGKGFTERGTSTQRHGSARATSSVARGGRATDGAARVRAAYGASAGRSGPDALEEKSDRRCSHLEESYTLWMA